MNRSLSHIVAENVTKAYQASDFPSETVLAATAGVAPNTLRNLMRPNRRERVIFHARRAKFCLTLAGVAGKTLRTPRQRHRPGARRCE